ncbi:hypothetical protein [Bifidobacterium magnum]|uniref:hypothetical protein n=1 Tax=Bifidobacterium magnum TaxID=1692 RepID=UPI0003B304F9|nr:hypothetical protein [Bifidobacterium magnum]
MNDLLVNQDGDLRHVFTVGVSNGEHGERLGLMYLKRQELQEMLDQVMDGTFNPDDAHWVLPILIEEEAYEEDSLV